MVSLQTREVLNFSTITKRKEVDGVSLLLKLKLNEFNLCILYCQIFIKDNHEENIKTMSPSLSRFRIVGKLSILACQKAFGMSILT